MSDHPDKKPRHPLLNPGPLMAIASVLGLAFGGLLGALVGYPWIGAGLGIVHAAAIALVLIVMLPPSPPPGG